MPLRVHLTDRAVLAAQVSAQVVMCFWRDQRFGCSRAGFRGSPATNSNPLHPAAERMTGRVAFRLDADEAGRSQASEQHAAARLLFRHS
jgi:hypothetical protein